jgi:hypothetical protein
LRFEHILQIYWTKGFFFGGKLFYFDLTLNDLFLELPGFGRKFKHLLNQRFELTYFLKSKDQLILDYQTKYHCAILQPLNVIFSQVNTVNNRLPELQNLNIIRLYLIKSYRGRAHALGKPVRGQRTWSNSWNSYNLNKNLRNFISETRNQLKKNLKPEKINYKQLKKKYASKKKKRKEIKKRKVLWF